MSDSRKSSIVVYAAIAANVAIAIAKFVSAAITGSSAMLSEGIHSTADSVNELLLLLGLHRSRAHADAQHPFGHGKELYFWSLIVAVVLFGVGAGMAMYEGITHLLHPAPLRNLGWSLGTLGAAAVFEGCSFAIAFRTMGLHRGPGGPGRWWRHVKRSKDPSVFTVFLEDLAALAGLAIAGIGLLLGHFLAEPRFDAAASVIIGLLLGIVAVLLARENLGLLVGESATPQVVDDIHELLERDSRVRSAERPRTMQLSPGSLLVNARLEFEPQTTKAEMLETLDQLTAAIRQAHPSAELIVIQPTAAQDKRDASPPTMSSA